jgi:hypothetical protein
MKRDLLYRSYLVLLLAAWEVFIEDLARTAHSALMELEPDSAQRTLNEDKLKTYLKNFHSPKAENINHLFKNYLGIDNIMMSVAWSGIKPHQVIAQLKEIIEIRGRIAHTVYSAKEETSSDAEENPEILVYDAERYFTYMKYLYNVACLLNNRVGDHIERQTGTIVFPHADLQYANT